MKYFKLTELIRCYREDRQQRCKECRLQQAASRLPNGIEENIEALVEQVLDPARERLGKPVVVNSGFRCPLHNKAVGGVYNSQHVKGEAADIEPAGFQGSTVSGFKEELAKLARIIVENGKFDQLILYPTFVHVSWKRQGGNRREVLRKTSTGYQKVEPSSI